MLVCFLVFLAFAHVEIFALTTWKDAGDPDAPFDFNDHKRSVIPHEQCNGQLTKEVIPCPPRTASVYTSVKVTEEDKVDIEFVRNDSRGPINIFRQKPCLGKAIVEVKTHCRRVLW